MGLLKGYERMDKARHKVAKKKSTDDIWDDMYKRVAEGDAEYATKAIAERKKRQYKGTPNPVRVDHSTFYDEDGHGHRVRRDEVDE